ncbi:MAG: DUF4810 domain-containing protein [Lacunisphaera sp.]|nr:DUF4810 domain-containing protein [Lacunisphaera sp.]
MKYRPFFLICLGLCLFSGCAVPPLYYYGNYSRTLYHAKKDGTPESQKKHMATLLDVIETSKKRNLRVPPGIYCEYGYWLALAGSSDADRYFALEVQAYPESARFVELLRSQIKK